MGTPVVTGFNPTPAREKAAQSLSALAMQAFQRGYADEGQQAISALAELQAKWTADDEAPPSPSPPSRPTPKQLRPVADLDRYYARLSSALYRDRGMSDSARRLVAYVAQMARGRKRVQLYIEQIADALGLSVRTVQYARRRAQDRGFLGWDPIRTGRINDASSFTLTPLAAYPVKTAPRRRSKRPNDRPTKDATRPLQLEGTTGVEGQKTASAPQNMGVQDFASHKEGFQPPPLLSPPAGGDELRLNPPSGGQGPPPAPAGGFSVDFHRQRSPNRRIARQGRRANTVPIVPPSSA